MITAQVETLADCLETIKTMFPLHHAELAMFKDKMPLDPQYNTYLLREQLGEVLFCTLRNGGQIMGYWVSFVSPGLHYQTTLTCTMDILFVHPDYRGNAAGFLLADCVKNEAIRRGVKVWIAGSKNHKEIGWFFERIGFKKHEEYYCMWLGE